MGGEHGFYSLGGAVRLCLSPGDGGVAGQAGAVAVQHQGGRREAGGVHRGRGRGMATRESGCGSGGRAVALLGWEGVSGSAVVLAGRQWRGGMMMVVGVPLHCWGGGGIDRA